MLTCISITPFLSVIGGGISATLGFFYARRLEKIRRVAAIKSAVFMLRDSFDPLGDIQKFHAESIPVLRDTISQLIPFISVERASKINGVWQAYRSIPSNRLKYDLLADAGVRFEKLLGRPVASPEDIVTSMLGYLEDEIRNA